jgi:imidazolonepropionase-like amidohydrolase
MRARRRPETSTSTQPRRTRRHLAIALILSALAAACGQGSPPPASRTAASDATVLRNFTLIDGTDRAPVSGAAMVVEQGRISWIGPVSDLKVPPGASPTDLAGAFVMPGLINLHGHVGNTIDLTQDAKFHTRESIEKDLRTYASYGVTTVLSMGTDQDTIFAVRDSQRDGRPSMARVYTAGQGVIFKGGYGGLAGVNQGVATPAEAEAAVAAQLDKKVDVIKLWLDSELDTMPRMPPAISKAIIDRAHKGATRVLAHIFYLDDAKRLVDQGIDGFVHSVRDKPIDQALIDGMKKRGIWQVAATLSREASMFAYGSTPDFANDPFFTRGISAKAVAIIKSPERQKTIAGNPNFKRYPAFLETAKANLKTLAAAGIPYGAGTDAGPPGRFPGYFEHWELKLLVDAGLTPQQALVAATRRGAEFLGAKDLGTLEASKWADFVVLDADPLADIMNTRTIRSVYIAGAEVPSVNQAAK